MAFSVYHFYPYRHPHLDAFQRAVFDVGGQTNSFIQFDQGIYIGGLKFGQGAYPDYSIAVYPAHSRQRLPIQLRFPAMGAAFPGIEYVAGTGRAVL